MGDQAYDILNSFNPTTTQLKKYDTVKTRFDEHFVVRRSIMFERANFSRRHQGEGESVAIFVTALHALAEYCACGTLKDQTIRNRIVVGFLDAK